MAIFVKEGNVKRFYFKDEVFLPEGETSDEFVEVKETIPYALQSQYQQKMSNSLVYSGNSVVKVKPEAFDVDIWFLANVVKSVVFLDDNGKPAEYTPKSMAMLEKDLKEIFVTKFVNGLITRAKKYFGLQEDKSDTNKEEDDLGESRG
jgi:hypothetical protein